MTVDERDRQHMIEALSQSLGEEAAMTLVEHLPHGGWSRVATHDDIAQLRGEVVALEQRMDARFAAVDARFELMEGRLIHEMGLLFAAQSRAIVVAFVTALIGFGGLMLGAVSIVH